MKITNVRLTPVNTPRHSGVVCGHVIVEIETDEGITGIGEMSDFQHLPLYHIDFADLEHSLNRILVGANPVEINRISAELEANFPEAMFIYDKCRTIKTGVDIALWDLVAKFWGAPVHDLLGGQVRDKVKIAYPIFRVRTMADVERNLKIVEKRYAQGFDMFRVYVGGNLEADEAFLAQVRATWGSKIAIKSLDFSNLLDWKAAAAFVRKVQHVGFELVESPARRNDFEGLAEARRSFDHPVSEHVYSQTWMLQMLEARSVDIFNISVIAAGGITNARRLYNIAECAKKDCLVGTTQELSIGTAAAAHIAAAMPPVRFPSDPVGPFVYTIDVVKEPVKYENGFLLVPSGVGLGMELDREKLAAAASPLTWKGYTVQSVVDRAESGDAPRSGGE